MDNRTDQCYQSARRTWGVRMLAAAIGFNDDDLRANREGRLTTRQRNRVFARRRALIIALTIITASIGIISAIAILAVLTHAEISDTPFFLNKTTVVVPLEVSILHARLMRLNGPYLAARHIYKVTV